MRTIRVWADTYSTGLIDETGRSVRQHETTISAETWKQLQRWVSDYDSIIPLSVEDRGRAADRIRALDERGIRLLQKVRSEWKCDLESGDELNFVYFSEGLIRPVPVPVPEGPV